jgi:hypothetical protein
LDPAISPPHWQQTSQCHSPIPIFNCIAKLRIDEPSTLDDLEDINSLIDTEVGVANLNQNEFENTQLMAQFQQDMAKIKVCEFWGSNPSLNTQSCIRRPLCSTIFLSNSADATVFFF